MTLISQSRVQSLLTLQGRDTRGTYWLLSISFAAIVLLTLIVQDVIFTYYADGLGTAIAFVVAVPWFCTNVRRLHDRNRWAWDYLLILFPFIGWIILLFHIGLLDGTDGVNRFGPRRGEGFEADEGVVAHAQLLNNRLRKALMIISWISVAFLVLWSIALILEVLHREETAISRIAYLTLHPGEGGRVLYPLFVTAGVYRYYARALDRVQQRENRE